ncbi:MAG: hypothetical protein A2Y64_00420 [Candidatus Coatesbacteria bacterium RBG_13_66_14]|uniref:Uncharacterized protein n=1 Tax=Candidatus Coatesbacteria bacterium RBG_13_66_14 TaxID=1817816 RepID=A0A1F5F595_9BACT|nr:MAG: hypothetical protein A2Y64_00420 [Candidatus Coatesbacteria bacterium RBG_13_66_14]
MRVQELVPADEIGTSGWVTKIEWQAAYAATDARFFDLELKLCHTPLDELTDRFDDNYGGNTPELVAEADPLSVTAGADEWFAVPDMTPYHYDGAQNLLVEVRWRVDNEKEVDCWSWASDRLRYLSNYGYDAESGTPSVKANRLRLTLEPEQAVAGTSWGVIKAGF